MWEHLFMLFLVCVLYFILDLVYDSCVSASFFFYLIMTMPIAKTFIEPARSFYRIWKGFPD